MQLAAKRAVFGSTMLFTTKSASLGNIHMLYQEVSLATPCIGCCLQQKELSWAAWCQFTVAVYCQKSFLPKPNSRNSCFCVYAWLAVLMHVLSTELKWMLFITFQQLFAHGFFFFLLFFLQIIWQSTQPTTRILSNLILTCPLEGGDPIILKCTCKTMHWSIPNRKENLNSWNKKQHKSNQP